MYNFHCNYIKKKYGPCAELCFTDTDSLWYDIFTIDFYVDMFVDQQYFDFSDYPNTYFLISNENKKVLRENERRMSRSYYDGICRST